MLAGKVHWISVCATVTVALTQSTVPTLITEGRNVLPSGPKDVPVMVRTPPEVGTRVSDVIVGASYVKDMSAVSPGTPFWLIMTILKLT